MTNTILHGDAYDMLLQMLSKSVHCIRKTTGWRKACKCATDSIVPAIVLDMFGGRNTTGIVARKNGRNFIAIEANEKDVLKGRERTYQELGIFSGAG